MKPGAASGLLHRRHEADAVPADRHHRLPSLRRSGCLNGCPVLAYEKDPVTGIVRHLDDQCIGCQYCMLKCPYDVPQVLAQARHRAQMRHVREPAGGGRSARLRAGLPERGDRITRRRASGKSLRGRQARTPFCPARRARPITQPDHALSTPTRLAAGNAAAGRLLQRHAGASASRRWWSCWC